MPLSRSKKRQIERKVLKRGKYFAINALGEDHGRKAEARVLGRVEIRKYPKTSRPGLTLG